MKAWPRRVAAAGLLLFTGCHPHPTNVTVDDTTAAAAPAPTPGTIAPRAYPVALPVNATSLAGPDATTGAPPVSESASASAPETGGVAPRAPGTEISMASPPSSDAAPTPLVSTPAATTENPAAAPDNTSAPGTATTPPTADEVVVIHTDLGAITIALDPTAAPATCANFRKLVASKFYDQTAFHRVIPHFIIQVGDPNTRGTDRSTYGDGGPGYTLKPEINLRHDRGAVAMARLPDSVNPERNSNGSQFYICVAPCPTLDQEYTVFGHVIAGMEIVDKISELPHDAKYDPDTRVAITADLEPRAQSSISDAIGHP